MSLLIATPCYGMQATEPFMSSRDILHKELVANSFPHDFLTIGKESLITRARNVIASSYLNETDFDCLLFIDADIQFDPADVAFLWNLCYEKKADVAVGPYRHKSMLASRSAWVDGKLRPVKDFDEPFEVDYAGTGFMMIRRETFHKLQELHPEWEYEEGFPLEEKPQGTMRCWAFFQDPIEECGHRLDLCPRFHLSEDYFFCKRVREAGMKVIMHPDVKLKHWGMYPY